MSSAGVYVNVCMLSSVHYNRACATILNVKAHVYQSMPFEANLYKYS